MDEWFGASLCMCLHQTSMWLTIYSIDNIPTHSHTLTHTHTHTHTLIFDWRCAVVLGAVCNRGNLLMLTCCLQHWSVFRASDNVVLNIADTELIHASKLPIPSIILSHWVAFHIFVVRDPNSHGMGRWCVLRTFLAAAIRMIYQYWLPKNNINRRKARTRYNIEEWIRRIRQRLSLSLPLSSTVVWNMDGIDHNNEMRQNKRIQDNNRL